MRKSTFDFKLFREAVERYEEGLSLTADMKAALVEGLRREAIAMEEREERLRIKKRHDQLQQEFDKQHREKWSALLAKIRSGEKVSADFFGP